jgi:predicted transcriptional regulator
MSTITVRLDKKLDTELKRLSKRTGRPKSDLIRDALRRQLALIRFEELRQSIAPFAEARGWLTDEDVFRDVS